MLTYILLSSINRVWSVVRFLDIWRQHAIGQICGRHCPVRMWNWLSTYQRQYTTYLSSNSWLGRTWTDLYQNVFCHVLPSLFQLRRPRRRLSVCHHTIDIWRVSIVCHQRKFHICWIRCHQLQDFFMSSFPTWVQKWKRCNISIMQYRFYHCL